jgi:hypothetical protein
MDREYTVGIRDRWIDETLLRSCPVASFGIRSDTSLLFYYKTDLDTKHKRNIRLSAETPVCHSIYVENCKLFIYRSLIMLLSFSCYVSSHFEFCP